MRKLSLLFVICTVLLLSFYACKKEQNNKETILSGETTLLTDESLFPITEDQVSVFENTYKAKLNIQPKPESELIKLFIQDSARVAILTRFLTEDEQRVFSQKNVTPKITRFALDAVVFITNKNNQDSLIDLAQVISYIKGNSAEMKDLVFDNPNSSTVRLLHNKAGVELGSNTKLFSKSSSAELLKFISENDDFIGVIGINWLTQTPIELQKFSENIRILSVKNVKTDTSDLEYYYPSQTNIGKKNYPLTRELYLLNYQGTSGLGMGFASFVASDIGQKIILTSGLAPITVEQLKINIKN